jgi:hypothetical protein
MEALTGRGSMWVVRGTRILLPIVSFAPLSACGSGVALDIPGVGRGDPIHDVGGFEAIP